MKLHTEPGAPRTVVSAAGTPLLYGLVLAGGRSSRMQRDKAAVEYHGRAQLERAMSLLAPHVRRAFVSVRPDQTGDPLRAGFAQILDQHADLGPTAGILAAQAAYPDVAWLVLACDLPFLDESTLTGLVRAREPRRAATAYRSSHDGLPEPLCAIYEPSSRDLLLAYVARGKQCPRKFLLRSDVQLLELPATDALDNVNTPEEYGSAITRLAPRGEQQQIDIRYYALLREQAGRSEERVITSARTPGELYAELRKRYPFSLASQMLRVAVNGEFGTWDQALGHGDTVVFIPPVAGG